MRTVPLAAVLAFAAVAAACRATPAPRTDAGPPGGAVEERIVTDDGIGLRVRTLGDGPDTLIVPFASVLAGPLSPLARGRVLISYDMRGRGRSDPVDAAAHPERLGLDRDVADLEAVRRHFGLGRFDLLGYSYLGAVAAFYAARHPERVRRLVLLAPYPPRGPHPASLPRAKLAALRDADALRELEAWTADGRATADPAEACRLWWRAMMPIYVSPSTDPAGLDLDLGCDLPLEQPPRMLATVGAVLGGLDRWDWRDEASRIRAPTLVVHGLDDRGAPAEGGREWAAAAGGRFVGVENAGHLLWAERPDEVLDAVDRFLGG